MNNYIDSEEDVLEKSIDFVGVFFKFLSYWRWFVVSILVCLIIALFYLKTTAPTYEIKATVLLKDDKKGGAGEMSDLKSLGLINNKNNVDNEVEVLKTANLTEQTIRNLSLNITYNQKGTFRNRLLYGEECPVKVWMDKDIIESLQSIIEFKMTVNPHAGYEFNGKFFDKEYKILASLKDSIAILPCGKIYFSRNKNPLDEKMTMIVRIQNPMNLVSYYLGSLSMDITSKTTSVVKMNFKTLHVERGKDFIKKLVDVYNSEDMKDQNLIAANTATFINERLVSLTRELSEVESRVENYKQDQGLTDLKLASELYFKKSGEFDKARLDIETQLAIISDIEDYINKKENRNQLLPYGSTLTSSNLAKVIDDYNLLILERKRLSRTASSTNQSIIDLTDQIESVFNTVKASVKNEKRSLQITRQDLLKKDNENAGRIKAIPRQEREYTEIKRQQIIKETLFLFLLQKKEENFLNMQVVVPKAKMIDKPSSTGWPVSPQAMPILIIAFVIGLILPILVIYIRDLIRFQIENKEELESISVVPVLGEIPKSTQTGNIIIRDNSTNRFAEMFRLLRTNLLFILNTPDKKIINIVSSVGGEGKTFISINLGMSLAMLNKKVIIIGLDVRKPKLAEYLGISNTVGLTLYLLGKNNKDEIIRPSGAHANLSVITAGPVPPNPNEMMAMQELDELMDELKDKYDYIILDTAPMGIVSDSFALNRFADVSLYVVRAEYTPKKNIEDATKLFLLNKVKNMYFVLNSSDYKKSSYRYGYGQKYGYGYGNKYGYGYGYEEENNGKNN